MPGSQPGATCERHPGQAVTGACTGCGKPLCRECAKQFGFYCSPECLQKARSSINEQSRQRQQQTEAALRRTARLGKIAGLSAAGLVALLLFWFAWSFFLDPAGKLCWEWHPPAGSGTPRVLACDASGVTVLAGKTVVVLDPGNGKERRTFTLPATGGQGDAAGSAQEADEEEDEDALPFYGDGGVRALSDGSILQPMRNGLRRIGTDGAPKFTMSCTEGSFQHLTLSPDQTRAYYVLTMPRDVAAAARAKEVLRQVQAEIKKAFGGAEYLEEDARAEPEALKALRKRSADAYEVLAQTTTGIVCLDLQNGNEVWTSPKVKKGTAVTGLAAGPKALYAVFVMAGSAGDSDASENSSVSLLALNPADGKRLWQAALKEPPTWGPVASGDLVLVRSDDEIKAFGGDGAVAYSIKTGKDSFSRPQVLDGLLWLVGEAGSRCYDAATGQAKWGVMLTVQGNGILCCGPRVYVSGVVEESLAEKDMKMPAAYEGLKDMPEVKAVMEQARKKIVAIAMALDRETGAELWRVRNAYGIPLGDEKRFVLVADTAQTSLIEMATGGKGTTIVRQFDTKKGKQLFTRQSELGFMEPRLVGKRVVGLTYERKERPSLFKPGSMTEDLGPTMEPQGVAAYRVK